MSKQKGRDVILRGTGDLKSQPWFGNSLTWTQTMLNRKQKTQILFSLFLSCKSDFTNFCLKSWKEFQVKNSRTKFWRVKDQEKLWSLNTFDFSTPKFVMAKKAWKYCTFSIVKNYLQFKNLILIGWSGILQQDRKKSAISLND